MHARPQCTTYSREQVERATSKKKLGRGAGLLRTDPDLEQHCLRSAPVDVSTPDGQRARPRFHESIDDASSARVRMHPTSTSS
jgi:hypothetical protein